MIRALSTLAVDALLLVADIAGEIRERIWRDYEKEQLRREVRELRRQRDERVVDEVIRQANARRLAS